MPSEIMKSKWMKIPKTSKIAFVTTVIVGLLTHLFILTNKMFNYNEVSVLFMDEHEMLMGRMVEGRWMVGLLGQWIGDNYSMQAVAGLIGILLIGCSAAMVVELLRINQEVYAILTGAIMIVFPALASFFAFTQLGDAWFMAVFFAVLAVWFAEKYRYGWLPAIVLIGISLAIHQAYISVAVAFMYCILFGELYRDGKTWKEEWKRVLCYIGILAGGFIFYYAGVKITAVIFQYGLSDYYGINEMTSFTPKGICKGIVYAYLYFLRYFFITHYNGSFFIVVVNILLACCLLGYACYNIGRCPRKDRFINRLWKVVLLGLLPMGMNCLPVLMADRVGAGVDRYMMYSLVFVWVLLLSVACHVDKSSMKLGKALCYVVMFGLGIQIVHDYTLDNQAYYREQAETEQMAAYLNRVAARMEITEGWNAEMPVYIMMDQDLYPNHPVELPAFDDLREIRGTAYEPNFNIHGLQRYFAYYLHFPLVEADEDQIAKVCEEAQLMPCFPHANSVAVIDGIMVVKLDSIAEKKEEE